MRPTPLLTLLALLPGGSWSCGGNVSTIPGEAADANAPEASHDASLPDATAVDASEASVADAKTPQDAGAEFCAPPDKAAFGSSVVNQPVVTTSMIVMDCCDGFVARFHTKQSLGADLSLMVRSFGTMESGDYAVPTDGGVLEVNLSAGEGSWPATSANGSVHLDVSGWDQPTVASFCVRADGPGDPADGARLFASDVLVAPFTWQNRFEVRLLADPSITAQQASQIPLDNLEVAPGEPIIHLLSLAWYEASSHIAHWDNWYSSEYLLNQLPPVSPAGLPFVVLADAERVYLGAFMTAMSSYAIDLPVIVVENMQDRSFQIEGGYPAGAPTVDPRDDPRIRKVFLESQKLAP